MPHQPTMTQEVLATRKIPWGMFVEQATFIRIRCTASASQPAEWMWKAQTAHR